MCTCNNCLSITGAEMREWSLFGIHRRRQTWGLGGWVGGKWDMERGKGKRVAGYGGGIS